MKTTTLTLSPEGNITLPEAVIEHLGLHPQQELLYEITPRGVLLKPKNPFSSWAGTVRPLVDNPSEQYMQDKAEEREGFEATGEMPIVVHSLEELDEVWKNKKNRSSR